MANKKIDKIIEVVRNYLGEEAPTMSTGSTPGKPGYSEKADDKGPVAGLSKPPNSTVPTTLNPCSMGVMPKPLFKNIIGRDNK